MVVICLVGIYFLFSYFKEDNEIIETLIQESNGTMDKPAFEALKILDSKENITAKDSFHKAQILDLNLHETRVKNPRTLDQIATLYHQAVRNWEDEEDDDLDWFEIQQIENFTQRNRLANNPTYTNFTRDIEKLVPEKLSRELQEAKKSSDVKVEVIDNYVQSNVKFTNDPQNVHDSAVNKQVKDAYLQLLECSDIGQTNLVSDSVSEIKQYLNKLPAWKKQLATKSLETILGPSNGKSPMNENLGTSEDQILGLVWARSNSQDNLENKNNIKDAVIESLLEMSEKGSIVVCSSGRISRMIGSLALLDSNPNIAGPLVTVEQCRNDMLQESNQILKDTIEYYKKYPDDNGLEEVAKSYEDPTIDVSKNKELEFKKIVTLKINNTLTDKYKTKLQHRDFEKIKLHCIEAIEST